MNSTEDEGIVTVLDMNWLGSLEKRVLDTKFRDKKREPTIYRVPNILKRVDPQAYEPSLVSLGPYHRHKSRLQAMNQLKWKYLKFVLEQQPGVALVDYVDRIKKLETRARDAYSEEVKMSSNSFVEMMLLDGCFVMITIREWYIEMKISEETRRNLHAKLQGGDFRSGVVQDIFMRNFNAKIPEESTLWTRSVVVQDIFMLENQLPFFLLETLYESAFPREASFLHLTWEFIRIHSSSNLEYPSEDDTFHHIIHLFHSCIDPIRKCGHNDLSPIVFGILRRFKLDKPISLPSNLCSSLLSQVKKICTVPCANTKEDLHDSREAKPEDRLVLDFPWIPSATVLNEAGINFEIKKKAKSFLDITFQNGKLQIPKLQIDGNTNSLLRNLIAYEQCSPGTKFHVSSYAKLMDFIIDTAEDVKLLQKDEIIISGLGDSQVVAGLFNKLPIHVAVQWNTTYFFGAINDMLTQRNTKCSKWRVVLNRNYFGNPWAAISLFGALVLFVLTVIQTIYAILSYVRSRN